VVFSEGAIKFLLGSAYGTMVLIEAPNSPIGASPPEP
jgi:hypothetical protein